MEEQILSALRKKALGYTYDEVQEEYSVNEDGDSVLTKKKIVKKYQPPDSVALKTYLELSPEKSYDEMTDEELENEKIRLLLQLKEELEKQKTKQKKSNSKSDSKKADVAPSKYQQLFYFGEDENNIADKN